MQPQAPPALGPGTFPLMARSRSPAPAFTNVGGLMLSSRGVVSGTTESSGPWGPPPPPPRRHHRPWPAGLRPSNREPCHLQGSRDWAGRGAAAAPAQTPTLSELTQLQGPHGTGQASTAPVGAAPRFAVREHPARCLQARALGVCFGGPTFNIGRGLTTSRPLPPTCP